MRFADIDRDISGAGDFIIRRRLPSITQLILLFLTTFLLSVTISFLVQNRQMLATVLMVGLCLVGLYIIALVLRQRDLVMLTEFQNAMFASALGSQNKFSMISRLDGNLVYIDRPFQAMFPEFVNLPYRTLSAWLRFGEAAQDDIDLVLTSISRGENATHIFNLRSSGNQPYKIVLTIEPISRPNGFMLLRGREYIENRSGARPASAAALPLYAGAFDMIDQALYITDAVGVISYASPMLEQWLGYGRGEMVANRLSVQNIIARTGKSSGAFELSEINDDVSFKQKNNTAVVFRTKQVLLRDAKGSVIGCSAVVRPAAADTGAPGSGGGLAGDLNSFVEHSPIAIVRMDHQGQIVEGNNAFHNLTQRTLVTRLPVFFVDLLSPSKKAEGDAVLKKALSGQAPAETTTLDLTLSNGVEMIVAAYFGYVENGGERQLMVHLIDITEQKNLELRFSHSQKMQAVGQLAGGVAHDFNNLLTAMIGFCDLLLMRHPAGDQSFADIMQIKQNANRAANLVRQLLAFSRRQTLQPKVLDLTDVLAELSNLIRRLIGENIELKMVHGRDIGHVRADQGQLEQVLINLAVNARDAMPGGGSLTIRTSTSRVNRTHPLPRDLVAPAEEDSVIPDGDYVLVEVIDTGCGIPKDIMQKIFEPFFSTKPVGSGTGLGLSTVYGIIKQTGGYLYVSSKENKGTNFSIYFPSVQAQEVAAAKAADTDSSEKAGSVDLTGKGTILLVEDETPVRIFAARALRNKGYTVLEADCAETAMSLMEKHGSEVEVIVTDVIMPGMNGPTMIDKLTPQYPNVKVIFISGYAEDVFVNNYGSERSFNFLAKPFTLKQLASKIKEVTG